MHTTRNAHTSLATWCVLCSLVALIFPACAAPKPHSTNSKPIGNTSALLNGQPISREQLWPALAEIAGGQVLDEYILTILLDKAADEREWTITSADIESEIGSLIRVLDEANDPSSTPRLIQAVRYRRGLGEIRFNALLRRNAILRRMIQHDPEVAARTKLEIDTTIAKHYAAPPPPSADALERITRRAKLVAQQSAMEQLARSMVDEADVLIMDPSLGWSHRAGE